MRINIVIAPDEVAALHAHPRSYVKGTLEEGGVRYPNISVRLKGNGSFQPLGKKPAFALKFHQVAFHGERKILLNNSVQDRSYLCQPLGGEIFRSAGVPAPRTTFAQVFCNGQNLGLYVIVQAITKQFLAQHFTNSDGNLYEGSNHDVDERLEVDSSDKASEQADLKELASALKIPDLSLRFKKLGALLDVDSFITFAAIEVLSVHRDGYSLDRNNFRIYHDPGTGLMTF
ncbi:MAG TPA: CotH kinase family protein, partial [Candidatus Saccharimonadales bacterium]|nr:CotH kinase family protein [Candidatus Saccharimonadales bacterium]